MPFLEQRKDGVVDRVVFTARRRVVDERFVQSPDQRSDEQPLIEP